eukprot:701444-Pleurochrysis_carterae.AAC.1
MQRVWPRKRRALLPVLCLALIQLRVGHTLVVVRTKAGSPSAALRAALTCLASASCATRHEQSRSHLRTRARRRAT